MPRSISLFSGSSLVQLQYDKDVYRLDPGCFWTAFPGPHIYFTSAQRQTSWHHRYVAFKGPLVQRWISLGIFPHQPVANNPDEIVTRNFETIINRN